MASAEGSRIHSHPCAGPMRATSRTSQDGVQGVEGVHNSSASDVGRVPDGELVLGIDQGAQSELAGRSRSPCMTKRAGLAA